MGQCFLQTQELCTLVGSKLSFLYISSFKKRTTLELYVDSLTLNFHVSISRLLAESLFPLLFRNTNNKLGLNNRQGFLVQMKNLLTKVRIPS